MMGQSRRTTPTSTWPKDAESAAMMMSASMASSQPPPRAKPFTAAMMGLRMVRRVSQPSSRPLLYAWDGGVGVGSGGK